MPVRTRMTPRTAKPGDTLVARTIGVGVGLAEEVGVGIAVELVEAEVEVEEGVLVNVLFTVTGTTVVSPE